jgi:hypothetical protein
MKKCTKCEMLKEPTKANFYCNNNTLDGLSSWCKTCTNRNSKGRYVKVRPTPKEGCKICSKCKEEKLATLEFFQKDSRAKGGLNTVCKLCENAKQKVLYVANPEKAKKKGQEQYGKYKDRIKKYVSMRYKTNPAFRASLRVRERVREFLQGKESISGSIGCSSEELREHLQAQFLPGMTWENYGKWHIDHKYPLSKAYAEGVDSFKKACHYTNLQPLWAIDNIRKSDKV